jgi:hypothetical protein
VLACTNNFGDWTSIRGANAFFSERLMFFTGLKLAPGWMIAIKRKVLKSSWLLRTVLCAATPFRFCPFSCPIEKICR